MEAQKVTHCILLCILAPFLYVPHFLQRRVRFSRKEILGIVQQAGEEFGVGFGESISHSFKSLFQRKQCDGRKSRKLGVRAPGFWAELRCTLSDHTPPSNSVYLWFELPMFNPALQYAKKAIMGVCTRESPFSGSWSSKISEQVWHIQCSPLELPIGTDFHKMGIGEWLLMDTMYLYGMKKIF